MQYIVPKILKKYLKNNSISRQVVLNPRFFASLNPKIKKKCLTSSEIR